MNDSRRSFLKKMGMTTMVAPMVINPLEAWTAKESDSELNIHVFSKHLQFLDWSEAAQVAKEIGFKGLDLTVRPKGHVLPENVKTDLPEAIRQIKAAGMACDMITTAIDDASHPIDRDLIATAGAEGVKFYRSNWFGYRKNLSMEESLEFYQSVVQQLSDLNRQHGLVGCYQNHAGLKIGASIWEVKKILESSNPAHFGAQYDIRHAMVEGGTSWPNGVKLIQSRIKTIVLKDYIWEKIDGTWKLVNVPIGDGMVDFIAFFKLLKTYKLNPPASLHFEYPLGGAEKGKNEITVDKQVVFDAMKNDLATIQEMWKSAYQ